MTEPQTDIKQVWLIDNSRITAGTDHCQVARYLNYHFNGYGIVSVVPPLDPWLGIVVHGMLAEFFKLPRDAKDGRDFAVTLWQDNFRKVLHQIPGLTDWTKAEQVHLAASLAYGWWRCLEEWFFSKFEVVHIEQEFSMDLTPTIRLMVKPDLVVRDLETKKLSVPDFKTMSSVGEGTVNSYRESMQQALYTRVVEEALGEPVPTYWIFALVKGARKYFEKGGIKTPEKRVYSDLCYASPPHPPISGWVTKGFWINKEPIWPHMTASKWVDSLPVDPTLKELFPVLGPYDRPSHMIEQALTGIAGSEERWLNVLWRLSESTGGWGAPEFHKLLDAELTRSYSHCNDFYGGECAYKKLCFREVGWQDPLGNRLYGLRRPHHEPERLQHKERGMVVVGEPWEVKNA